MSDFAWGVSGIYRGRAHLVPGGQPDGLCGLPMHDLFADRPEPPALVCSECALAFVHALFPTNPLPNAARAEHVMAGTGMVPAEPDRVVVAEVISVLGRLKQACGLVQVAIPTEQLTAHVAAEFVVACEHAARSVLKLSDQTPELVDEQLRDAAHRQFHAP